MNPHESHTAEKLRELIREDIKKYYRGDKQDWPMGFRNGLNALCRREGHKTVTSMLDYYDAVPNQEINEKLIALAREQGMYVELWE
jgi:hypothetical protein